MLSAVGLHATAILSLRPSVRLSRALCIKTAERIIEIILLSVPIILVFCHQGLLRKSEGFTPNGGAEYKGRGSDFRPICDYIS